MLSTSLNIPVTLFSRARRVLDDKVVTEVHHHDDFSAAFFKHRAGVTHHSSKTWQVKTSLHPGVATDPSDTFAVLVFTVAVLHHTTVGINIPGVIIQSFHWGQAVNRVGH